MRILPDPRHVVVLGACLTQFVVIGLLLSYGVFMAEFEAELGWSRSQLSAAASVAVFMMGTLAMVAGRLSDLFGPSRVLATTGVMYGLGYAALAWVTAPWQLVALFATLIAAGLAAHDVVTLSTVAHWFQRRKGLMSGVVKVGTAAGQVAVPPLAAALILWLGWRPALVVLGLGAAVLLVLAALAMQRPPPREGAARGLPLPGTEFALARRSRVFWTLCAIQFLFFPTMMSVPLHLAVHGMDLGLSKPAAATLLSVVGLASVAGRLTVGAASDRLGGPNAFSLCLGFVLVALVLLSVVRTPAALFATVAIYGFGHGGLFVVVSPTVAAYFGLRAHGAIFGTVLFFGTLGGAIGPTLLGWVFDNFGSYAPAFIGLAVATALAIALARTLPPAPIGAAEPISAGTRP